MNWLNYHHLLYFYTIVTEGGLSGAGRKLRLSAPALSVQLRSLENSLKEKLFDRSGKRLALTEVGRVVFRYAEEIFELGHEMTDAIRGKSTHRPVPLTVGISDALPKLVAYKLLRPALQGPELVKLNCHEDNSENLLSELSIHKLDLVLTDAPVSPWMKIRAYNHLLGECGIVFFGTPALAHRFRRGFPGSLEGAPFLVPAANTALRRCLDGWLEERKIQLEVVGEFDDSALLKVFGQGGHGIFLAPSLIEAEVKRQYGVQVIGRSEEIKEKFYAISVERRLQHPILLRLTENARNHMFRKYKQPLPS